MSNNAHSRINSYIDIFDPSQSNLDDPRMISLADSLTNEIMIPDLKLGDAVLFNFKTVHGSTGNNSTKSRRAFSMRFIGDDVRYKKRYGKTSPPFDGINLKTGATLRKDWFPVVWKN